MELVDIGVNLDHRSFERDRAEVIEQAKHVGVRTLVLTGTNVKASQGVLELARRYGLYSTAGVHPHTARQADERTIPALREMAKQPEVVAIGECGLDYNRDFSPRPQQDEWFEKQIELAIELNLPLFLHERDAHDRFAELLGRYRKEISRAVVHCFTGTRAELEAYLAMDLHIGITGWICDERRGKPLQELVKHIPLDRLMLETDAPFLTPRNINPKPRDGRNEPKYLTYVLNTVAECVGKSPAEVAQATTQTAKTFLNL
jgi:TatD DNase family protein